MGFQYIVVEFIQVMFYGDILKAILLKIYNILHDIKLGFDKRVNII